MSENNTAENKKTISINYENTGKCFEVMTEIQYIFTEYEKFY